MARIVNRLSARKVEALTKSGRHADGDGLYLSINGNRRRWIFLFRAPKPGDAKPGRQREMGLGSASTVTLKEARDAAAKARALLKQGIDPLEQAAPDQPVPTFGEVSDEFVSSRANGFRNEKHIAQWKMTLETYAGPLRGMAVDTISTADIVKILKPLWVRVPETASRLRGRIEMVLDAARAAGHRAGDNPARLKGHLDHLLPSRAKMVRGHHKALPYDQVPDLVKRLSDNGSISALCLEFTILTAARSGESRSATWDEFDLEQGIWTIPALRMKAGREHRVPLSPRAEAIVSLMADAKVSSFVFPGQEGIRPTEAKRLLPKVGGLSNMAMPAVMKRMKIDATVHGFRSSFRDWTAEATSFPREVAEAALAHVLQNKVEAAYRRSDLFEKRRGMMIAWATYCEGVTPRASHDEDAQG